MNVTRANIDTATDEFTSLVSTASFIAMDLEMTGISLPGPETKEHLMDTPSMRYVKMRQVASRFSVIQVGLTLFHAKTESKTEPKTVPVPGTTSASTSPDTTDIISSSDTHTSSNVDAYDARVYNVFTFPQKGQITLDGSAVDFLVNNGMDWNAWFENGVPYLRQGPAEKLKLRMFPPPKPTSQPSNGTDTSTDTAAVPQASPTPTPIKAKRANANAMVLNKTEDINFCKDALAGVAEWAKAIENIDCNDKDNANANDTSPSPSNEHILPSCNSYRRRFLYQELEHIYGNGDNNDNGNSDSSKFTVETRTPNPNRHWEKLMVILCLTPAQRAAKEHADHLEKVKQYNAKLGFRRMWTALTQSNRPLVVHNGLYDLMFMVHHMHDDLPDTLEEFKIVVGGLFPGGIYDTRMVGGKIFVKDNALEVTSRNLFSDLRLDRVYGVCKSEADAAEKDAAEKEAEAANANASTNSSTKGEEHSSAPSSSSSSSSSSTSFRSISSLSVASIPTEAVNGAAVNGAGSIHTIPTAHDCDEEANCVVVDACDEEKCRTGLDVRIHGEWYNLSGWRKAHPAGGHWIDWYDGRDATEVMDGFHSEKARGMWQRLPKTDPQIATQLEKEVIPDSTTQINFRTLRAQLVADGWWERDMVQEAKLIGIYASLVVGAAATAHTVPLVSIALTGLAMTNSGWLGHDYIHGVDKFSDKMRMFAAVAAGLGPTWWSDKHNKHHALTNEMGVDEDIATDPFLFPWAPDPKHDSPLRKIQHLIFFIPFSFLFALWRVDTMSVVIKAVEDKRPAAKEELYALLAHYGIMLTLLPLSVWIPATFMSGLMSALIVTPTHQNEEYFEEYQSDFVTAQFESTRNAVTTNPFSEWLWGGMQYQLEHHLFPTMPRSKYPALRPILMKFAEDNNIPGGYRESGEFEILIENWKLYKRVAEADAVPGAPYSRGHGQLAAINLGFGPAAGGLTGVSK